MFIAHQLYCTGLKFSYFLHIKVRNSPWEAGWKCPLGGSTSML